MSAATPPPGDARGAREPRIWLQRMLARGFEPEPEPSVPVTCVLPTGDGRWPPVPEGQLGPLLPGLPSGGIALLCPTYVGRCTAEQHAAHVAHVLSRLEELHHAHPDLPVALWVGMQWSGAQEGESLRRLAQLGRLAAAPWVSFVGLSLPGPGKIRTINASVRLSRPLGIQGWVWVDDDIRMEPRCLERLVSRFLERGCRGAVGAAKVPLSRPYPASRGLHALKKHTAPLRNYPHACCMVVQTEVIAGGIPVRRLADDGFVLFELLDPSRDDPYHDLEVVAAARCVHYTGDRGGGTLRRSRRLLYSHLTCMADYSWPAARRYFSDTLFFGLWPLAPWDGRRGATRGALRWLVKAAHFCWFSADALALLWRAAANRPLREVSWGAAREYQFPSSPAVGA